MRTEHWLGVRVTIVSIRISPRSLARQFMYREYQSYGLNPQALEKLFLFYDNKHLCQEKVPSIAIK